MKKSLVLSFILLIVHIFNISAQDKMIPLDLNVRFGKLENGLTYYIRHNESPAERADFYLVMRVGSTVEEENERGLAHFLEHTAFNGTTNFPNNSVRNYLETIGVKDANASTSLDQTVYKIPNAPTIRKGIIDSCLLILHDWSSQISLIDKDIEKERSIIREEWRTRRDASRRMNEKLYPIVFAGSGYANAFPPLGTIEVIDNFKPAELRDFYHRWYRPDLQAIIIVGAVDVDKIEAKIKKLFADIPASAPDAPKRIYPSVPDNKEPIIAIVTDPESTGRKVSISFKHDPISDSLKKYEPYYRIVYLRYMAMLMMNTRLNDIAKSPSPPFGKVSARDDKFLVAKTKDAWQMSSTSRSGVDIAFEALLEEMERVLRFGFTPTEYERAKVAYISWLETKYNERNNTKNNSFVNKYISHFTDNEPFSSIEFDFALIQKMANILTVQELNDYMKNIISDSNRVVMISGPENKKYPTETEILATMARIKEKTLTAYEENLSDEPLVPTIPQKGKITSINENTILGTKELLLSNGTRVSLKKTDFKEDQILFSAAAKGGLSMVNVENLPSVRLINDVLPLGGLGNFNAINLRKKLAGERVTMKFTANLYNQSFTGNATVNDTETLLQLFYLTFTAPRQDEDAFLDFLKKRKNQINNRKKNIENTFNDSIEKVRYGDNPYSKPYTLNDLKQADYNRIIQLYRENFASDVAAYHFTFVGNIDEEVLLPLIEQYIASLPVQKIHKSWRDVGRKTRTGKHSVEFKQELQTPKATIYSLWSGDVDYTSRNITLHSTVVDIMRLAYNEKIREEQGGTYGITVNGGLYEIPKSSFYFSFRFDTDTTLAEPLLEIANAELDRLQTEGPSEENWQKVRESMLKKHNENLAENNFWLGALQQYQTTGLDKVTDYVNIVNSITTNEIRDYARNLFSQKNNIKVIRLPE